ncbi:hypothetical protein QBC38DRAFT_525683, partial [Podospora fimiseda]
NPPGRSPYLEDLTNSLPAAASGQWQSPSVLSRYISLMIGLPPKTTFVMSTWFDFGRFAEEHPDKYFFFLSQALNTYWIAISGGDYVLELSGANYSSDIPAWVVGPKVLPHDKNLYVDDNVKINFGTAQGVLWSEESVFTVWKLWLILLFISIIIPLVACMMNLWLTLRIIKGPHLAMNFSTLTRDNPFVMRGLGVGSGGSALSDEDRGELLRDLRIRFGNVRGKEEVGHVGIGMVDGGGGRGRRRLGRYKGRLYELEGMVGLTQEWWDNGFVMLLV